MMSNIVAGAAVIATFVLGWLQWRLAKRSQDHITEEDSHEETVAMARTMDERINAHFTRLELAVAHAEDRIAALEDKVGTLSARLERAIAYIREHGLPWPPPGERDHP
jgi:predicted  nucleic acid-binding Zn-ribbon protein